VTQRMEERIRPMSAVDFPEQRAIWSFQVRASDSGVSMRRMQCRVRKT